MEMSKCNSRRRLQALPADVVRTIAFFLDPASGDALSHSCCLPGTYNKRLYIILYDYLYIRLVHFRLEIGSDTVSQDFTFGGILRELKTHRMGLTILDAAAASNSSPPFFTRTNRDTLGRRIFRQGLSFPALRLVTLDAANTSDLDLLPYLAELAPNLETLVLDISSDTFVIGISSQLFGLDLTPVNPGSHCGLRNLKIAYDSYAPQAPALIQNLLDLCPHTRVLSLHSKSYTLIQDEPEMVCLLLRSIHRFSLEVIECTLDASLFAACVAQETIQFASLLRIWCATFSWHDVAYRVVPTSQASWPPLGMVPDRVACLLACPYLHQFGVVDNSVLGSPTWELRAYISSYTHPAGEGDLLHGVLLVNGEWWDVTDYEGEVVPLEVIDEIRNIEKLSDEEWPGTQRERGTVVGDAAWEILTRWYESGPRAERYVSAIDGIQTFLSQAATVMRSATDLTTFRRGVISVAQAQSNLSQINSRFPQGDWGEWQDVDFPSDSAFVQRGYMHETVQLSARDEASIFDVGYDDRTEGEIMTASGTWTAVSFEDLLGPEAPAPTTISRIRAVPRKAFTQIKSVMTLDFLLVSMQVLVVAVGFAVLSNAL